MCYQGLCHVSIISIGSGGGLPWSIDIIDLIFLFATAVKSRTRELRQHSMSPCDENSGPPKSTPGEVARSVWLTRRGFLVIIQQDFKVPFRLLGDVNHRSGV